MKKVDCSTLHVNIEKINRHSWEIKNDEKYTCGYYEQFSHKMYIFSNIEDIDDIVSVISHESLHKILALTIGKKESKRIDNYLRGNNLEIDNGGI